MAWQAITRGANGIFFYSFMDIQRNPDVPFTAQWNILTAIATEIERYAKVLLSDAGEAPAVTITLKRLSISFPMFFVRPLRV